MEHVNLPGFLRRFSLAFRSFAVETVFLGDDDSSGVSPDQPAEEDEAAVAVSYIGSLLSSLKMLWKAPRADVLLGGKFERT